MADPTLSWPDFLSGTDSRNDRAAMPHGGVAMLRHLGVLSVSGPDAASFLHNQLTNDVLALPRGSLHLAGYCSAKGRLLATMIVCKTDDAVLLVTPRDLLPGLQKRLQMFVLRAKVALSDVSEQHRVIGIAAPDPDSLSLSEAAGCYGSWPSAPGLHRGLWIGTLEQASALGERLSGRLATVDDSVWRWLDIRAGLPMVVEATREQFVPQMINFDLVGGVNFRKGCYPGQEVVARSQYLGKLKRRMRLASVQAPLAAAGMEVFSEADPGQPCGMVVNAERNPQGDWDLLVEIKLDLANAPVHLGAPDAALLQFADLPYALRDPE